MALPVFEFSLSKMYRDGDRLPEFGSPERVRFEIEQQEWLRALRGVASPFPRCVYPATPEAAGGASEASHLDAHYGKSGA
jgi:hypothetical protein